MSKLIARGITKVYGKKEVLHGIDLELESGKIYGLIGRNGAGKTTLLSILTAQNPATAGSVAFDGMPVWENPAVLEHLCFSRELNFGASSGLGNIRVKDYLRTASLFFHYWDQEMADWLMEEFHLERKGKLNKLSKGMLSMLTIIVALASRAEFTFLDEPAAGLDVVAREKFYRILLEEFSASGRTFVISTHIIEEAADVFEEVIMVDRGSLLLKENLVELLDRSYHVSGHEEMVDRTVEGLSVYHPERVGRSKGVTVLLKPGEKLNGGYDVDIQKPGLQKVFVALCGEEDK